jgi:hypothetical protein
MPVMEFGENGYITAVYLLYDLNWIIISQRQPKKATAKSLV